MAFAALTIDIKASMAKFETDMKNVTRSVNKFGSSLSSIKTLLGGVLAGVGIGGFLAIGKAALNAGGALTDLADVTGLTTKQLQELSYAGATVGISSEEMEKSLQKFAKSVSEAATKTGTLRDAFTTVGVSVKDLKSLDMPSLFEKTADGLIDVDDAAKKAGVSTAIFGRGGYKQALLFSEGLRQLREEANRVGAVIDDGILRQSDAAADRLDIMAKITKQNLIVAFSNLAPVIETVGKAFAEAAPKVAAFFSAFVDTQNISSTDILEGRLINLRNRANELRAQADERAREELNNSAVGTLKKALPFRDSSADLYRQAREVEARMDAVYQQISKVQLATHEATEANKKFDRSLEDEATSAKNAAAAAAKAKQELDAMAKALDKAFPDRAKAQQLAEDIDNLRKSAKLTGASSEELELGIQNLQKAFAEATGGAKDMGFAADELAKKYSDVARIFDETRTPIERFNAEMKRLEELKPTLGDETFSRAVEAAKVRLKNLEDAHSRSSGEVSEFWAEAARNMENAMADGFFDIMQGKLSDLETTFKTMIDRMVANALAARLADALFGADFSKPGGKLGGWTKQAIDLFSTFGGARAEGGSVSAGKGYLVGERGPELFVPKSSGTIMPNGSTGGMTINVNVRGDDIPRTRQSASQFAFMLGRDLNRHMARQS